MKTFEELIKSVKNRGYAFQMEILIRAMYAKYRIKEIPIKFVDRLMGKSKLGFKEVTTYFRSVMKLYLEL
jgi:dolichol-phosphate mannosyltransferase